MGENIKNLNNIHLSVNSKIETVTFKCRKGNFIRYFVPDDEPHKMICIPAIESATLSSSTSSSKSANFRRNHMRQEKIKSEICLKKLDRVQLHTKSRNN